MSLCGFFLAFFSPFPSPAIASLTLVQAIKALHDKLADTRNKLAPRSRFAFKTARKNPSAMSLADMAEIDAQGRRNLTSTPSGAGSGTQSPAVLSGSSTPAPGFTPIPIATNGSSSNSGSTTPVTSTATSASAVTLSSLRGIYVISPHPDKTASTLPAYVSDVQNSVIDMTGPREDPATMTITARPFAGLAIRQAVHSVLVCGQVDGPAHVTSVRHAVLVVACQQFRMHECSDVDVYLSCASKPIIEACTNIRFAPLPAFYVSASALFAVALPFSPSFCATKLTLPQQAKQITLPTTDQWNQVQDFGWIKAEPSPNWSLLPEDDAVPATLWREVGAVDRPRESLDAMLRAAKVVD